MKLHVVGHTDNVGSMASNMELSKQRAPPSSQRWLSGRRDTIGFRWSRTIVAGDDESEEGRAKNRRVELVKQ